MLDLLTLSVNVKAREARNVGDMDQLRWLLVYMAAELPALWSVVLLAGTTRACTVLKGCAGTAAMRSRR
jgi:hypothetical protein